MKNLAQLIESRWYHLSAILIIATALFIPYSNSYYGVFSLDDYPNIVDNSYIRINTLSYKSLLQAATDSPSHNRLLPNISFALNYYKHGYKLPGYHIVNLAIHFATAIAILYLFLTLLNLSSDNPHNREIAFLAALLWALHPVQTNAVTYIVQRMTSMATLFYVLSVLSYIQARLRKTILPKFLLFIVSAFCFILAVLSKEIAIMLPILFVAVELFFFGNVELKKLILRINVMSLIFFVVALTAALVYLGNDPVSGVLSGYENRTFSPMQRLLTQSRVLIFYLSLLVIAVPCRLNLNHNPEISTSLFNPIQTLPAMLLVLALIILIPILYKRYLLISFAIFWFLANHVIESTIIPLELVFEHRLYLPSIMFFCAGVHFIYDKLGSKQAVPFLVAVAIVLTIFTWQRNFVWKDSVTLWTDVIAKSPNLSRAYLNLGNAYLKEENDPETAYMILKQAYNKGLDNSDILVQLGKLSFERNEVDKAIEFLSWAVKLEPENPEGHYNLGIAYSAKGMMQKAQKEMELGMRLKRQNNR